MNILHETIKDYELSDFSSSLSKKGYTVELTATKFNYTGNSYFNLENFKDIFCNHDLLVCSSTCKHKKTNASRKCIAGPINVIPFKNSVDLIDQYISYSTDDDGLCIVNQAIFEERKKFYWNTVLQNFKIPPTQTFKHDAEDKTFLGSYIFWGFCFIYLNDNDKSGLVLTGSAWD